MQTLAFDFFTLILCTSADYLHTVRYHHFVYSHTDTPLRSRKRNMDMHEFLGLSLEQERCVTA